MLRFCLCGLCGLAANNFRIWFYLCARCVLCTSLSVPSFVTLREIFLCLLAAIPRLGKRVDIAREVRRGP
jgi:hypothetical protein